MRAIEVGRQHDVEQLLIDGRAHDLAQLDRLGVFTLRAFGPHVFAPRAPLKSSSTSSLLPSLRMNRAASSASAPWCREPILSSGQRFGGTRYIE